MSVPDYKEISAKSRSIGLAAMTKALKNGWNGKDGLQTLNTETAQEQDVNHINIIQLIFNHEFAKALWGEDERTYELHIPFGRDGLDIKYVSPKWQYHLQQMVVADDPVIYLGDNLEGDK